MVSIKCAGEHWGFNNNRRLERPPYSQDSRRHLLGESFFRAHGRSKGAEKIREMGLAGCEQKSTGAKPDSDKRRGEKIQDSSEIKARQVPLLQAVVNPSMQTKKVPHFNSHWTV